MKKGERELLQIAAAAREMEMIGDMIRPRDVLIGRNEMARVLQIKHGLSPQAACRMVNSMSPLFPPSHNRLWDLHLSHIDPSRL